MQLALTDVRQKTNHDCGTAAWRTVYQWHTGQTGRNLPDLSHPINGLDPAALEAVIRVHHGWNVLAGEMLLADLRMLTVTNRPVICPITDDSGVGHYVVVGGVDRWRVHYHDPAVGPRLMRLDQWDERWVDMGKNARFVRWGLAAWPA